MHERRRARRLDRLLSRPHDRRAARIHRSIGPRRGPEAGLPRPGARSPDYAPCGCASRRRLSPRQRSARILFATTAILGGGWGLTSTLEVGGQLVAVAISPELQYTNPSLYITYGHSLDASTSLAPTLQAIFPLRSGDPFTIDVGAALAVNIGAWGEIETAPTLSINLHQDGNGTSLSLPLTVMRQASTRINWQLSIGVGFSRFDPRFALSRRSDALDFNDVTIPASAQVMYTVPRDASADALVDIALQGQFPQLYTNRPDLRGWQTNDWTLQLQTSWYVLRTRRAAAQETAARGNARRSHAAPR